MDRKLDRSYLKSILAEEGIRPDSYDLDGRNLPEKYTLRKDEDEWFVYYSERGNEIDKTCFKDESDACVYLLKLLKKDSLAQLRED